MSRTSSCCAWNHSSLYQIFLKCSIVVSTKARSSSTVNSYPILVTTYLEAILPAPFPLTRVSGAGAGASAFFPAYLSSRSLNFLSSSSFNLIPVNGFSFGTEILDAALGLTAVAFTASFCFVGLSFFGAAVFSFFLDDTSFCFNAFAFSAFFFASSFCFSACFFACSLLFLASSFSFLAWISACFFAFSA